MKKSNIKLLATLAMLITTIIWGISFVIMKTSLDSFQPAQLVSLRFGIAAIITALLFIRKWKYFTLKTLLYSFIIGLFTFIAYMFQTYGLMYTSPGKNAFLTVVYCVIVPFVGWFALKQKPKKKNLISALLCIIGIGLISLNFIGEEFRPNLGDFLTLGCSIFFALQITYQNKFSKSVNLYVLSALSFAFIAVFSFIFGIAFEGSYPKIEIGMVPSLAILSLGATALCFMLQNFGLKYANPNDGAIILSLEAVFGTIASFVAGYEEFSLKQEIGFLVVFAAVLISQLDFTKFIKKSHVNESIESVEGPEESADNSEEQKK